MREQSSKSDIKNRAITDPSRKWVIPTCKAAIAKYFLSILKDNPYLYFYIQGGLDKIWLI